MPIPSKVVHTVPSYFCVYKKKSSLHSRGVAVSAMLSIIFVNLLDLLPH